MTAYRLLVFIRAMHLMCENGLIEPFEIMMKTIIEEVHTKGLEPSQGQTAYAISFAKVENYLMEVLEQAKMLDYRAAVALVKSIQDDLVRCGIQGQLPREVIE
jgi:hypothetical protein